MQLEHQIATQRQTLQNVVDAVESGLYVFQSGLKMYKAWLAEFNSCFGVSEEVWNNLTYLMDVADREAIPLKKKEKK